MDQLWVEVAKQVPALAVLVALVVMFMRQNSVDRESSEKRLERVNEQQAAALDNATKVVSANTECLGGIRTLLSLVEQDLKNAKR